MCGIGAICSNSPVDNLKEKLSTIGAFMLHRGPDFMGTYLAKDLSFGLVHTRLSINDLSPLGNQPISNENETIWLICNGEIYNHKQLRKSLQDKGHKFRSTSDSEIILHLYEEYGVECLSHIQGMFAFVLYEAQENLVFCARDKIGKKPLVYAKTDTVIYLASEMPAIKHFPGIDIDIDPVALSIYLSRNFRHVPEPLTIFKGIKRLMPGHAMLLKHGKIEKLWKYWQPEFRDKKIISPAQVLDMVDSAIQVRSDADVEVAVLLSGGVDSTIIVDAMQRYKKARVKTYALGRNANDIEIKKARYAAKILNTEHKEVFFDPNYHHSLFLDLLRKHGDPIMLLPLGHTYELCQHIKADGIKVVMTGHGADELFYGYTAHNSQALISLILPYLSCLGGKIIKKMLPFSVKHDKLRELSIIATKPAGFRKSSLYQYEILNFWKDFFIKQAVLAESSNIIENLMLTWLDPNVNLPYIDEANIIGLMLENTHSITIAGDLPAMAASVEVRCPFLDNRIIDLCWNMPFHQKVGILREHGKNKFILKEAFSKRLPKEILYAKKTGFGYGIQEKDVLLNDWKKPMQQSFASKLEVLSGVLNLEKIREYIDDFYNGKHISAMHIAKLYALVEALSLK